MTSYRFFVSALLLLSCFSAAAQDLSWYKCFTGKIDKYPVTLHLHKAGHEYHGYYYYNNRQEPLYLLGEDTSHPGMVELVVYINKAEGEYMETFLFALQGNAGSGSWKMQDNEKTFPFTITEAPAVKGLVFDYVFTNGKTELFPGRENSPTGTYSNAAIWPKGNSAAASILKTIIAEECRTESNLAVNPKTDLGQFLLNDKKQFLDNYKEEQKEVKKEDIEEETYAYSAEFSGRINMVWHSDKIVSLANASYSYTGGAHGMFGTGFSSYNLSTGKALKLADIVNPAGIKLLPRLLDKNLRKLYNLSATEKLSENLLFEDHIEPNENFMVTQKGILFNYVPYEVAAYAYGEIRVFIPFAELKAQLQPAFQALLK